MNFSREAIITATPKIAAKLLLEAGRDLTGKNLRKRSWLEIAEVIQHQNRLADIVAQRLRAARTRDDALRVLRIVRKAAQNQHRHRTRRAKAAQTPTNIPPRRPEIEPAWDELLPTTYEFWAAPIDYEPYFQEWQAEHSRTFTPADLLLPGVWPVSPLQAQVVDFALSRKPAPSPNNLTLRSRLDEATIRHMQAAVSLEPHLDPTRFTAEDRAFFERYGLTRLHQISSGGAPTDLSPVTDGYELAGLTRFDDHDMPLPLDWVALGSWLEIRLTQPPGDDSEMVIRCAYKFVAEVPPAQLQQPLLSAAVQPGWRPLLGYWRQRQTELFASAPRGLMAARYAHLTWEDVLALGLGSRLVLHHQHYNYQDMLAQSALSDSSHWAALVPLLTAGAGTLRRLDYPTFTLTCRPVVSLVSHSTFIQLAHLARTVLEWHADLLRQPMETLLVLVAEQCRDIHGFHLPDHLLAQVARVLEQHAIAYVLLKTDVLAEAPFRLRRRHIRRFWVSQQAGQLADLSLPDSLADLLPAHGLNLVLEGLLHTLLDHLHEQWTIDGNSTISLKAPFIVALRHVALAYNYQPTHQPIWHNPTESDLERAGDIADLLVQRFVHAPLEITQALRLPPDQGLPRLNGGHVTALERRYRHVLREAAGSDRLAVLDADAPVTTYTCRPISKLAALDRGQLGGDCSSDAVPLRALSPHHVYYGLFVDEVQQRGYMTVYEAWAELADGRRVPVLCLETINAPLEPLRAVQQDLLLLFEAIAHSRGLSGGLVLIMRLGTWNYYNGEMLRQSRRYRQGTGVWLHPADPVQWRLYEHLAGESAYYNAFNKSVNSSGATPHQFRLLAPFDPALDLVQPENRAEAERLTSLSSRQLIATVRGEAGVLGFISGWPEKF